MDRTVERGLVERDGRLRRAAQGTTVRALPTPARRAGGAKHCPIRSRFEVLPGERKGARYRGRGKGHTATHPLEARPTAGDTAGRGTAHPRAWRLQGSAEPGPSRGPLQAPGSSGRVTDWRG